MAASSELPCQLKSKNFWLQGMFGESEPQEQSMENQRDEENRVFLKSTTVESLKARKQGDQLKNMDKNLKKGLTILSHISSISATAPTANVKEEFPIGRFQNVSSRNTYYCIRDQTRVRQKYDLLEH